MLIIFGLKTTVRMLGIVTVTCRRCGNPAAHRLEERRRIVTLFFIPVIPLGRRTTITCTYCGTTSDVDAGELPNLLARTHDVTLRTTDPGSGQPGRLPDGRRPELS
jgi:hypothetical protein